MSELRAQRAARSSQKNSTHDRSPSEATLEKVAQMKQRVESTVQKRISFQREREVRLSQINKKLQESELDDKQKQRFLGDFLENERSALREERHKVCLKDFSLIKVIGKGGFGEVRIVRNKHNKEVYAMKTMRKKDMIARHQAGRVKSEKDLMEKAVDNPFLDDTYLYLVMEYCGGGDFMAILMKHDTLTEAQTAFYIAEVTLAINAVHDLEFVHRFVRKGNNNDNNNNNNNYYYYYYCYYYADLKPDNILIASNGHIKLTDFGLAKSFNTATDAFVDKYLDKSSSNGETSDHENENDDEEEGKKASDLNVNWKNKAAERRKDKKLMYSTVAPEVFHRKGYDKMVDWWSMGVIMFETVVGYPPFYDDDALNTCKKIVHYRKHFKIPTDIGLSSSCIDLIKNLVCSQRRRYGFNEICNHEWFRAHKLTNFFFFFFYLVSIFVFLCTHTHTQHICHKIHAIRMNFARMQEIRPPFIPHLKSDTDGNFETLESDQKDIKEKTEFGASKTTDETHFWGYTFKAPIDLHSPQFKELMQQIEQEEQQKKNPLVLDDEEDDLKDNNDTDNNSKSNNGSRSSITNGKSTSRDENVSSKPPANSSSRSKSARDVNGGSKKPKVKYSSPPQSESVRHMG
ncbi:hypothetical protein RFI_26933 [Reticulomyxa filosa]|uniref:non-specific serine/threonine protein kinase n=1 Tax=Reticulomyxa filosa TaxID=46433 RepID=X6MBN5_RETFI|nr:hypothetical protein RFI_26933 [Reticulomyxa filosa]|eukprot:ETO10445.1 hypothetical protein RFI_26933 [Reticulomyxa filosa]